MASHDDPEPLRVPPLGLRILACRWRRLQRWGRPHMGAPFWRWYWTPAGDAWVEQGGRRQALGPGEAVLIAPNTDFAGGHAGAFEHLFIHFCLHAELMPAPLPPVAVPLTRAARSRAARLAATAAASADVDAALALDAHLLVIEALAGLPPDAWRPPVADPRVRRALDVLRADPVDPPDNATLAAALGLHPASLVRLFRAHAGVTPQRWALLRRLDGACADLAADLAADRESVETVASRWGFADRHHFSRLLKRHRGLTPGAVRRGH